jgi:hypothetical protein
MMKKAERHFYATRPVRKFEATMKYTGKPLSIQDAAFQVHRASIAANICLIRHIGNHGLPIPLSNTRRNLPS